MCVYENCPYLCTSKKEHHSRYARIRKNKPVEIIKTPSPKVNWNVVKELKMCSSKSVETVKNLSPKVNLDEIEELKTYSSRTIIFTL